MLQCLSSSKICIFLLVKYVLGHGCREASDSHMPVRRNKKTVIKGSFSKCPPAILAHQWHSQFVQLYYNYAIGDMQYTSWVYESRREFWVKYLQRNSYPHQVSLLPDESFCTLKTAAVISSLVLAAVSEERFAAIFAYLPRILNFRNWNPHDGITKEIWNIFLHKFQHNLLYEMDHAIEI
nr:hypothetical protein Iba_chr01dCG8200 [Ipomoea batatas]